MIAPDLRQYRPVNLQSPVNWNHPLNRQRVAWWLTLPQRAAGFTWYDLAGRNPGTLTNMANSSNGWRPTTRPGGWGSMLFDGLAGQVTGSDAKLPTGDKSVAAWFKSTQSSGYGFTTFWGTQAIGSAVYVGFGPAFGAGGGYGYGVSQYGTAFGVDGLGDGNWHRSLIVNTGSLWKVYIDGEFRTSENLTTNTTPGGTFRIGAGDNPGDAFYSGLADDIAIWSRALSPAEVLADYQLSMRGYPGVLNRVGWDWYGNYNITSAINSRRTLSGRVGTRTAI